MCEFYFGAGFGEMCRMEYVDLFLGGCTSMCEFLLGFSSLMFLFDVGAFVYDVIPWYYVRSGSYMSAVVVLLQACISSGVGCLCCLMYMDGYLKYVCSLLCADSPGLLFSNTINP
jgi:hypothetical protein